MKIDENRFGWLRRIRTLRRQAGGQNLVGASASLAELGHELRHCNLCSARRPSLVDPGPNFFQSLALQCFRPSI